MARLRSSERVCSKNSLALERISVRRSFAPHHAKRFCVSPLSGGASAGCAHLQWPARSDSKMADDTDIPTLRRILHDNQRIAIVGISAEWHRPSYFAGKYMLEHGYTMIPANPKYESVLGQKCYPNLRAAREYAGPIDLVDCFRRPEDVEPLVDEAVAIGAKTLWMQLGIVNEAAARKA